MTSAGQKRDDAAPGTGDELERRFPTAEDAEGDELRIEITPNTALLAGVTKMVESFAANNKVPEEQIFLLNLAVDELLTNYVEYSRKRVRHPRMELTIRVGNGKIVLTLLDTGPPFNPLDAPDPDLTSGIDERELGGLGLQDTGGEDRVPSPRPVGRQAHPPTSFGRMRGPSLSYVIAACTRWRKSALEVDPIPRRG